MKFQIWLEAKVIIDVEAPTMKEACDIAESRYSGYHAKYVFPLDTQLKPQEYIATPSGEFAKPTGNVAQDFNAPDPPPDLDTQIPSDPPPRIKNLTGARNIDANKGEFIV